MDPVCEDQSRVEIGNKSNEIDKFCIGIGSRTTPGVFHCLLLICHCLLTEASTDE